VLSERHGKKDGGITDVAECDWNGQHFEAVSRNGVTMALARQLVAAGAPDGRWEAYGRGGDLRLFGRGIHRLAGRTIKETDAGQFRFARYEELPLPVSGGAPDGELDVSGGWIPEAA
jgi:hypothetical protein